MIHKKLHNCIKYHGALTNKRPKIKRPADVSDEEEEITEAVKKVREPKAGSKEFYLNTDDIGGSDDGGWAQKGTKTLKKGQKTEKKPRKKKTSKRKHGGNKYVSLPTDSVSEGQGTLIINAHQKSIMMN